MAATADDIRAMLEEFRRTELGPKWDPATNALFPTKAPKPVRRDPLAVATEFELSQPQNPEWRSFEGVLFRVSDVISVNMNDPQRIASPSFTVSFRTGHPIAFPNNPDFRHTGISSYEWFVEYVMLLPSKRRELVK